MSRFVYTPAQKKALKLLGGDAGNIMLFGGSRSGKTFLLCCALLVRALRAPGSRHAVIRRYANTLHSTIGCDTIPKVLASRFGGKLRCKYCKSDGVFALGNGAEIWLAGLDDDQRSDKILGREFATLYFNECSELHYDSVQTALTRLAQNVPPLTNKALFDCNPPGKDHWTYQVFIRKLNPLDNMPLKNPADYAVMQLNPADNSVNLPPGYIENTLASLPLRQRQRFLAGNFLDVVDGALWTQENINVNRVSSLPPLQRVVIGVDPAVTSGSDSDYTGIVAAALGSDGHYYILGDHSVRATPLNWSCRVVDCYRTYQADRVVGEVNNGGDLIETLLRNVDSTISFRAVRAARGKIVRAEPVAALYEKNMVHHAGAFPELETEMVTYCGGAGQGSPDRLDALVWAITDLTENNSGVRFILA